MLYALLPLFLAGAYLPPAPNPANLFLPKDPWVQATFNGQTYRVRGNSVISSLCHDSGSCDLELAIDWRTLAGRAPQDFSCARNLWAGCPHTILAYISDHESFTGISPHDRDVQSLNEDPNLAYGLGRRYRNHSDGYTEEFFYWMAQGAWKNFECKASFCFSSGFTDGTAWTFYKFDRSILEHWREIHTGVMLFLENARLKK